MSLFDPVGWLDYMIEHPKRSVAIVLALLFAAWLQFWEMPQFVVLHRVPNFMMDHKTEDQDKSGVPETPSGSIGKLAIWDEHGNVSEGNIRYITSYAEGWDGLGESWPLLLAIIIVTGTAGWAGGHIFRDNAYAMDHERDLAELTERYESTLAIANRNSANAEKLDRVSQARYNAAYQKETDLERREKAVAERQLDIEKTVEEKVRITNKQFQKLQEDHKNRCYKMEGLEKEKIEHKRKNIALEKEIVQLSEANLVLTKENLRLKREK